MATPLARRPEAGGASPQVVPAASGTAEYAVPASLSGIGAQAAGVLGLLTGVWVALSPSFITLQYGGSNATAVDLISGLAVAAAGAFALASPRGFSGLQLGSLLLGIWLIIAPPILDHKHPIAHAMYWSNSFSGGVLIALAAAGLGFAALPRSAAPGLAVSWIHRQKSRASDRVA